MADKFSYQRTVQSLARVLAQIKPTPWEKVRKNQLSFCDETSVAIINEKY